MKVAVAIGSRANWGSLRTACTALRKRGADVRPVLFASALSERYGDVTASLARDDFTPHTRLACHIEGDISDMAKTTGLAAIEWGTYLRNDPPDVVLICGDRHEVLGAAMAAAYAGVRIAHTMGGEVSGNVDDRVRDAVTALTGEDGVHCVATLRAGNAVMGILGEELGRDDGLGMDTDAWGVHVTGCPRIDTVREVLCRHSRASRPMVLVSQHPVTTSWQDAHAEMAATLQAVSIVAKRHGLGIELCWPNADAGTGGTHQAIREWLSNMDDANVRTHRTLGPEDYARLMADCRVMVGNSSSALRDGAWIGTPAVNVGNRQRGREHGPNVLDASMATEIALETQLAHGPYACSTLYGDGFAGVRVAEVICG